MSITKKTIQEYLIEYIQNTINPFLQKNQIPSINSEQAKGFSNLEEKDGKAVIHLKQLLEDDKNQCIVYIQDQNMNKDIYNPILIGPGTVDTQDTLSINNEQRTTLGQVEDVVNYMINLYNSGTNARVVSAIYKQDGHYSIYTRKEEPLQDMPTTSSKQIPDTLSNVLQGDLYTSEGRYSDLGITDINDLSKGTLYIDEWKILNNPDINGRESEGIPYIHIHTNGKPIQYKVANKKMTREDISKLGFQERKEKTTEELSTFIANKQKICVILLYGIWYYKIYQ